MLQVFERVALTAGILKPRILRAVFLRLGTEKLPFFRPCWSTPILEQLHDRLADSDMTSDRRDALLARLAEQTNDGSGNLGGIPVADINKLGDGVPDKPALATAVASGIKIVISFDPFLEEDIGPLNIAVYPPNGFLRENWLVSAGDFKQVLIELVARDRLVNRFADFLQIMAGDGCMNLASDLTTRSRGGHDISWWELRVQQRRDQLAQERARQQQ